MRHSHIFLERALHRSQRSVPMRDYRSDVNLAVFDQTQRPRINRWSSICFETTRSTNWSDQCWLAKHDVIQHTQLDARMTVTVKHNGCLLANQSRHRSHHAARAGSFNQVFNASSAGFTSNNGGQIRISRIKDFVCTKTFGEVSLPFTRS